MQNNRMSSTVLKIDRMTKFYGLPVLFFLLSILFIHCKDISKSGDSADPIEAPTATSHETNLKNDYCYLLKDEYGIPNEEGLVLMHCRHDSIYVDPNLVINLDLTPDWGRNDFPREIFNFPNVKNLYIGMRSFTSMPNEITRLSKLESIDLQNSLFKYLPPNIGELTELRELVLLESDVEELPASICNLKKLKRLQLGNTNLRELPNCMNELTSLEILIMGNEEKELPNALKRQIEKLRKDLPNCEIITPDSY